MPFYLPYIVTGVERCWSRCTCSPRCSSRTGSDAMVITIFGAAITLVAVLVAAWFLGGYMVRVFTGERVFMTPVVRPVERVFYRLMDVREDQEQSWIFYLVAMMLVQVISFLLTYFVLRFQNYLPLNPQNFPGVPPALAFNTAVSFTTNTNWQNYTGESTMSYFSRCSGSSLTTF